MDQKHNILSVESSKDGSVLNMIDKNHVEIVLMRQTQSNVVCYFMLQLTVSCVVVFAKFCAKIRSSFCFLGCVCFVSKQNFFSETFGSISEVFLDFLKNYFFVFAVRFFTLNFFAFCMLLWRKFE